MNPPALPRSLEMFTDIWTARKSAFTLSKTLMAATMVIAIGTQFAVITADDFDGDVTVINEYDPFA
jgi:hypothetical protein